MAQQLGNVAVGTVLKLNEDGVAQDYIVVHQGIPSSLYDSSCNGTWLLHKNNYSISKWRDPPDNTFEGNGPIQALNTSFLTKFSPEILAAIKSVKIPYRSNYFATVQSGANGYPCKAFMLSPYELGWTYYIPESGGGKIGLPSDGACLSYFNGTTYFDDKRANGVDYWTRTQETNTSGIYIVTSVGGLSTTRSDITKGLRPAIIMQPNLIVDDDGNITANVVPSTPGSITVPTSAVPSGSPVNVTWTAGANATGYILQRRVNGGSWQTVYTGANLSYSDTAQNTWTQVQYQVAATTLGFTSAYIISTEVTILPYTVVTFTVPSLVMQGQTVPISWEPVSSADTYVLQRKVDSGEWEQVYSGKNTSYTDTAGSWNTVQYQIQAGNGSVFGTWTTSGVIPVISASALVISGTDEDLGTITKDVPYTVSSDTGNPITLTRTVNGVQVTYLTVQSGFAYKIPVMDLPTGKGTIVITATVQAASGSVSATRTWTYTKTAMAFPSTGGTAQLRQDGKNVFPATLAECVRVPANLGGSLDKALEFLSPLASKTTDGPGAWLQIYPVEGSNIEITAHGYTTQEGTGDPSPDNVRPIKTGGVRLVKRVLNGSEAWFVTTENYTDDVCRVGLAISGVPATVPSQVPTAKCDRYKTLSRDDTYKGAKGFSYGVGAGYIHIFDPKYNTKDKLTAWKAHLAQNPLTVWLEMADGSGDLYTPIITEGASYHCECLPLNEPLCEGDYVLSYGREYHTKRLFTVTSFSQADGGYSVAVENGADGPVICNVFSGLAVSGGTIFISADKFPDTVTSLETANQWLSTQVVQIVYSLSNPVTYEFPSVDFIADPNEDGSVIVSGENMVSVTYYKSVVKAIQFLPKIETGSYVGTGTYGADSPNTLTFKFEPKVIFITDATTNSFEAAYHNFAFLRGAYYGNVRNYSNAGTTFQIIRLNWSGNSLSFYNDTSALYQLNSTGITYTFVAFG